MTNQQLKAHCEDVIANPQDHLDWVVDMTRVALASLEAEPSEYRDIWDARVGKSEALELEAEGYTLRKLYDAPPVPELKPISRSDVSHWVSVLNTDRVQSRKFADLVEAIRAAGYEVK